MSEQKAFLEKVHIKNFLSLRNVTLPFKPLTVLVGPNASGKSNVLRALNLLGRMVDYEKSISVKFVPYYFWDKKTEVITFQIHTKVEETQTEYQLELKDQINNPLATEKLSVNDVQIISIQNGKATVSDEDRNNKTTYESNKLALGSAGDYGNKTIIRALTEFIRGWGFYDFRPNIIRQHFKDFPFSIGGNVSEQSRGLDEFPKLYDYGHELPKLLTRWYYENRALFEKVKESLAAVTDISMDFHEINREGQLSFLGGLGNKDPIHLWKASDGALRILGYCILLNDPKLPPLIAIEEPERNLHPGALKDMAYILERLAERTQVIITTHSSQLLDAFSSESLSDWLGVLLLRNRPGLGTEVINIEDIRNKRESLAGWMSDFGIGSAVFDSELLQDLMEEPVC